MAAKKEFAGHTEFSLRHQYSTNLKKHTREKFKLRYGEVTVEQVAEYCRQVHGQGRNRRGAKREERQQKVIDFFHRKVEELGIADFI